MAVNEGGKRRMLIGVAQTSTKRTTTHADEMRMTVPGPLCKAELGRDAEVPREGVRMPSQAAPNRTRPSPLGRSATSGAGAEIFGHHTSYPNAQYATMAEADSDRQDATM